VETVASFTNSDVDVVVAGLNLGSERVRASALMLSDTERLRASRFRFDRDRHRFIVARALLRRLIGIHLGVPPESVEFAYGAHGKPILAPQFADSGLNFNLSHCDDVATYAFSYGCTIGIDIEAIRVIGEADAVAARYFSRCENSMFCALDPRHRPLGFFNCWTRKEAFIKAVGNGLSMPLDHFDVSLTPGEPAKVLRVGNTPGDDSGWSLESFVPAPGYVAAIAYHS
jgi:4'-phosphopantetheinyl transferase